jgi:predicted ATPase/class 3 adenylate cyclase/tRNA A-37 threonylcarbamoyl transferase component Bud32
MLKLDGYQIFNQIYESGNSSVYRGQRESDRQPVILKYLKEDYPTPSELTRYKQEYEITRKLNLEGTIRAYELKPYKQTFVIILEDVGAVSLRELMTQEGEKNSKVFSIPEFIKIGMKVAEILGSIHAENIIHKDINPSNIIIQPETGKIKIIDFGISTVFNRETLTLKNPNVLEGTLAYISPEQTGRMNRSLDYRTDFYSLGVTFYELLTGQLPFITSDSLELVHCHIAKQPIPPSEINLEIPSVLSAIVLKLMAKTAEERYQSAFGIQADLAECLRQLETEGRISDFPLGRQDISDYFQIPQKLYGREEEVEILLSAFDRVVRPNAPIEMMLVAGYSGIGKSSLVAEIHKPNTRLRGYFTEGKFDQFQRSVPYSAIVSAFKGLVRQLLGESEAELEEWRSKLLAAFGSNGQVIIDVIPEVELIVGKQPPVPVLGASESQSRFNLVFGNFIRAFCTQEHPLAIFLDDLQWADSATLKLIELIMTDEQMEYLFLIGAYRDNEVSPTHPLMITLDGLQEKGARINTTTLKPLKLKNTRQILADTLSRTVESVQPLAELVMRKTGGNPFFVNQFLKTLHAENLITFTYPREETQKGFWSWNLEEIEAQNITDNVVDLMVGKLKKLPNLTQKVLRLASCIGASFALSTLAIVSEQPKEGVFKDLVTAVQTGFVLPTSELDENLLIQDYKFLHDRVQQAAYALIDDDRKKLVHLQIGRLLLENVSPEELPERLFEIVDHLNIAWQLIDDDAERVSLAQLNLEAGRKAKASTAYAAALEEYFTRGIEILPGEIWQEHYDLAFSLYRERCECEFLCGNFEQAEELFDYILSHVKSNVERAEIQNIRLVLYDNTGKFADAIAIGAEALESFELIVPTTNKSDILSAIEQELQLCNAHLKHIEISTLIDAPEMSDAELKACMNLLMNMTGPAYFTDQDLLALISLKMVNLSIEHGNCDVSAHGYAFWGFLAGARLFEYEVGYEFGLLSMKLNEKFHNVNLDCKVFNMFGGLINPWRSHLKKGIPYLRSGYLAGVETGDVYVSYNSYHLILQRVLSAENFQSILEESGKHLEFLNKIKNPIFAGVQQLYRHFVLNLQGLTLDKFSFSTENFNEEECLHLWNKNGFLTGVAPYNIFKAQILFLYGDYEGALEKIRASDTMLVFLSGVPTQGEHYLYYSLIVTTLYPTATETQQQEYDEILIANQEKLKIWADNCPENFLHKYLLVEAEIARIRGQEMAALDLYDRAIASAREYGYTQNQALGNELAAKFWLNRGKEEFAEVHMKKAHNGYLLWGATRKVEDLEAKYPQLLKRSSRTSQINERTTLTSTDGKSSDLLDLATVLKANQAISGEIVLDNLLSALMKILVENAGAQRGILLLSSQNKLTIAATKEPESAETIADNFTPIEEFDNISTTIVRYVARTKQAVFLDDATSQGNFTEDAYIQEHQCHSIACVPFINQGKLQGIIYLENNLTTGAFTEERVALLQTLATQAAISLENARFYDACKRFVPERFLSLLEKKSIVDVKLGDRTEREMTILFSDIRSFTTMSEKMTPEENFAFINSYLGQMEPLIEQHGGFIDKYIGDAIMALFPTSADDAVSASLAMLEELKLYNQYRQAMNVPPIKIGIGLHTGKLMLGMVGGTGRMDGTAIGDAVNLSSRVEGLTKTYGAALLITYQTWQSLNNPNDYEFRFIDKVKAKGKTEAVGLLEVFSADPTDLKSAKIATRTKFEKAVLFYHSGSVKEAASLFQECLDYHGGDRAARIYLERCRRQ